MDRALCEKFHCEKRAKTMVAKRLKTAGGSSSNKNTTASKFTGAASHARATSRGLAAEAEESVRLVSNSRKQQIIVKTQRVAQNYI